MSWDWEELKRKQQGKVKMKQPPKKEKKKVPEWMWYVLMFTLWLALAVGLWFPFRWLHYKFAYEGKIEQKIIEMVNPEALKDKYKKEL